MGVMKEPQQGAEDRGGSAGGVRSQPGVLKAAKPPLGASRVTLLLNVNGFTQAGRVSFGSSRKSSGPSAWFILRSTWTEILSHGGGEKEERERWESCFSFFFFL